MVLFAAMLLVVVAAPMAATAATAATARQHPSLRERVLRALQELPVNEA
jgi:hypothetical protein